MGLEIPFAYLNAVARSSLFYRFRLIRGSLNQILIWFLACKSWGKKGSTEQWKVALNSLLCCCAVGRALWTSFESTACRIYRHRAAVSTFSLGMFICVCLLLVQRICIALALQSIKCPKHCKSTKRTETLYTLKPQPQNTSLTIETSAITQVILQRTFLFPEHDKLFIKGFILMK